MSNSPGPTASNKNHQARVLLYAGAALVAAAALGYYAYVVRTSEPTPVDEMNALRGFISNLPRSQQLADGYRDADGDLVADAPSKLQDVNELGFSLVAGDDPERTQKEWRDVMDAIAKATGKPVRLVDAATDEMQLAALRDGKLHITAFSTGEVAAAVNTAGFVPLAAPADASGKYAYEMEILTSADSTARSPADLKGKTIAFTALSSNSGAKAPMVILKESFDMLPGRDYRYVWTGGHQWSLKDLKARKHDAVCVANDLLARAVAAGELKPDEYRSIYTSASFPPLCLGVAHDLPPEDMAKIKQAILEFRIAGSSLQNRYQPQGIARFAPVDYKRDWAYVREIDAALLTLLDRKGVSH